jgi:beta-lactam-binding protein with PASTA domain
MADQKIRDANLNIRVVAARYDLSLEPRTIIAQTHQGGERVDCGTAIGLTMSDEDPRKNKFSP